MIKMFTNAQNLLRTFLCNFPVDGEAANLLRTCLSTLATIVADFGDKLSPKTATVLSQKSTTVAEFDRRQSPFSAKVALFCDSVDRTLRTCYGETGVMDSGLKSSETKK